MEDYTEFYFDNVIHQTSAAVAFDIGEKTDTDEVKPCWIPKACIDMETFDETENSCEIKTAWLIEKGLV